LDLVIAYGLNINITSVVDLALSDHFVISLLVLMLLCLIQLNVLKKIITSEVAENFTMHYMTYEKNILTYEKNIFSQN